MALSPETLGPGASRAFPRVAGESDAEARRLLSQGFLSLANMSAKAATLAPRRQLENPFRFADVPPGVLPPDAVPLAQDAALQDTLKWAADQHDQRQLALDEQAISFLPALGFAGYQAAFANGYGYLGFSFLSELAQVAEYRIISETIASELTREWIEFKTTTHQGPRSKMPGDKAERIERIEERFEELKVKDRFREVAEIDGLLGRGHLYLDTGDTDERAELQQSIGDGRDSLSRRKVSREHPLKRIAAIEATWCYPNRYNSSNPLKADWYRPQTWFVMGFEVHVTRLLLFVGREVPDLLKAAYNFGGLSLSQMAKPYVDNWLRTRQAVADLIWSFSNNVLKTDLQTLLQGGVEAEAVLNRVRAFNAIRNNQGTLVINKDTEDWVNVAAPIAGLHELQAQAQEHMASVSRIPLVKLLGIQPSGLNASSEGEIRSFYDTIAAYQEKYFREPLTRVLNFVQLSLFGDIDPEITFEFKPLWQLDEVAEAGVQQQRAATRETDIAAGIITPEEAREALADDPKSQYSNIDLEQGEAPGMQPEEGEGGEPELDPETGEPIEPEPDFESEQLGGPKPKTSRLGQELTNRAAEFGSPATGGFGARDTATKLSQSEVKYTAHASDPGEQCHLCEHFLGVDGGCDLVEGTINPQGWCEEFQAR